MFIAQNYKKISWISNSDITFLRNNHNVGSMTICIMNIENDIESIYEKNLWGTNILVSQNKITTLFDNNKVLCIDNYKRTFKKQIINLNYNRDKIV